MSDGNSHVNRHEETPPPPPRGNPIPNAPVNRNPSAGRIGPIINLPIPKNLDGKRDHSRAPGLDLTGLVPRRGLNTNAPPTEGHGVPDRKMELNREEEENPGKGKGKAKEEEFEELGEEINEEDDSDFEILDHPVMTPPDSPQTEGEAYAATSLLTEKVPPELVPEILDYAEYFPHTIIGRREEKEAVGNNGSKVYLVAHIPDFEALDKNTAGKGGAEGSGGRPGRVRRLTFRIAGCDQGWSSFPRDHKTYKGSWSWFEVELWRKGSPPQQGDVAGEGSSSSLQQPIQGNEEEREKEKKENPGKYKVGSWLLQRNKHAERTATEHEVTWDWKEDELDDSVEEKWEPDCMDTWQRNGRIANGKLIRELRGGDELRVVMRSQYPGWRCNVEKCEIECWWAV